MINNTWLDAFYFFSSVSWMLRRKVYLSGSWFVQNAELYCRYLGPWVIPSCSFSLHFPNLNISEPEPVASAYRFCFKLGLVRYFWSVWVFCRWSLGNHIFCDHWHIYDASLLLLFELQIHSSNTASYLNIYFSSKILFFNTSRCILTVEHFAKQQLHAFFNNLS